MPDLPAVRLDLGLEARGRSLEALGVRHQASGALCGAASLRTDQ
jgi:hypothetical protein